MKPSIADATSDGSSVSQMDAWLAWAALPGSLLSKQWSKAKAWSPRRTVSPRMVTTADAPASASFCDRGRSRTQTRTLSDAAIVAALLVKGKCRPQLC